MPTPFRLRSKGAFRLRGISRKGALPHSYFIRTRDTTFPGIIRKLLWIHEL